jgi:hypothetical protein
MRMTSRLPGFLFALAIAVALIPQTAPAARQTAESPTFSKDIAPIFYKNCVGCHRPGQIAPMSLLTYAEARPFARSIRTRIDLGTMPPWHAEAPVGVFSNDRRLTAAEKELIGRWVANGAPEGDPKDIPPAPVFPAEWMIGKPDAIVKMAQPYDVPASGTVRYQYFTIPTNFTEDKWVRAIEVRPGVQSVVHHVLVFAGERRGAGARPPAPPFVDRPVGLTGPLAQLAPLLGTASRAGNQQGTLIATMAPGTSPQTFEPGAMRIRAGTSLTLQIHYTATGKTERDQTSVGFVFAKEPPAKEVHNASFVNVFFSIPPGAENHRVDSMIEFTADAHIVALFPHTHLRGKSWEYRMTYPDGREEVVLNVPHYDFNWQTYYQYAKPLAAPKGSKLLAIAHYDNSANNKSNPNPKSDVRWGDQTWEEMQYSGITYTVD